MRDCNKIRYASRSDANRVPPKFGRPYKCSCGHWHVGHKVKKQERAKKTKQLLQDRITSKYFELFRLVDVICGAT